MVTPPDPASPEPPSAPQAGPAALELRGAGRRYGAQAALAGVTLRVAPGERVALVGPSGAGKSTLLALCGGTVFATEGQVRLLGEDPAALPAARLRALRARVASVRQQLDLVPQASALENVLMGALGRRSWLSLAAAPFRRGERQAVAALLGRVGLSGKLHQRLDRLSGGEQQRVAVARALWQGAEVWLCDEPFASVDPERSAQVVRLLLEAAEGRTLVLSTHQLGPVLPHFPRIVGLRGGRLLFDKPREAVSAEDLAALYQPEEASASPEPRQLLPAEAPRRGELRVGASTAPGEYLLPRAVPGFAVSEPEVRLRLLVNDTAQVLEALRGGAVELAFVGARLPDPALHFEDFAEDEILLVASPHLAGLPSDPLSPAEAGRLPRVDREPGSATRTIAEKQLAALGAPLDPAAVVFEAGSVEALKAAVAGAAGVGFASRLSVAEELKSGRLVALHVSHLRIPRRFYAVWRSAVPLSAAARAFLSAARRAAGGRP